MVGETRFWAGWLCDQGSPGLALGWKWLGPRSADCRACSVLRLMLAHWWLELGSVAEAVGPRILDLILSWWWMGPVLDTAGCGVRDVPKLLDPKAAG